MSNEYQKNSKNIQEFNFNLARFDETYELLSLVKQKFANLSFQAPASSFSVPPKIERASELKPPTPNEPELPSKKYNIDKKETVPLSGSFKGLQINCSDQSLTDNGDI